MVTKETASNVEPKPLYVPPPFESDAELDPNEQALVRALVNIIVREIREEESAANGTEAASGVTA